jgi:subtilase family serine protease
MVTQDQSLLLVVDPNGDIEESENLNNQITIAIALGAPPPENPFATPTEAAPVEEPVTP